MWKVDRHFVSRSIFRWFRVLGWTSISGFITISQAFTDYWLVGSLQSPVGLIQLSFSPGSNLKLRHRPQVRASHLKTWKVLWPTQRSRPRQEGFGGLSPPKRGSKPPPNWNMKHYESVFFLSNLWNVRPPIEYFLATIPPHPPHPEVKRNIKQRVW